jgi:transcriptional regulator with XRE-family HTH domain
MPRPSKRVSPETLGGRIRAARQNLKLSLAQVAGERYSTSLISQIERNRVDPSQDSLEFLAERLKLPLKDLVALSQQHRASETDEQKHRAYEEQRAQVSQLLESNQARKALERIGTISIEQLPSFIRWRFYALRGQCSFKLRKFLPAQRDFLAAIAALPGSVPTEQRLEVLTLRLSLAVATRELGQLTPAYEQLKDVLTLMDVTTPLRYVAETHWELALVISELVHDTSCDAGHCNDNDLKIQDALQHAENARTLYLSIGETLRASLLQCQVGIIEHARGNLDAARQRLHNILETWLPTLEDTPEQQYTGGYKLKERANAVSAAAAYLANVELDAKHYEEALTYVQTALAAGEKSYILRRAEAKMIYGSILETMDVHDLRAEAAFQGAVDELAPTDRIGAKIRAYELLGLHLVKKGEWERGQKEIDKAHRLSHISTTFSSDTNSDEEDSANR